EELITDLAGIQGVPLAELKQMLMQFDQVKFAGATAHPGDVQAAILDIAQFVQATCNFEPPGEASSPADPGNPGASSRPLNITPGGQADASVLDISSLVDSRDEGAMHGRVKP
ncbi:MAG: hypothetical protein H7210_11750, partial [Pyrinomonadaceae bacterium]|nr:hypothetical protein [Phycisphaerales bacterium]